ncbi:Oligopeptide ABC transporter, periplasmic oligopeptide-binding protein OppA (TC 3.A.1.5.1) [hydrothermal vent metagenome]|uniref:Oligopeptide ABC transporter, periplasmic oligopeptide-binding protein OppA (TC 3.A.1.5.1) n=1 Tax=hydrothermal vent metagenome TaxID=652676 RepID=A0A3B0W1G3_9ZZZZ
MKLHLRWQLLLALVGFSLILAILSFQVQSVGLCSTRVPASGGVFSEGIVGVPQWLNPLLSDNFPVDRELGNLLFDGLIQYDHAGRFIPALAESWTVREDGRSIQFTLRNDIIWHDGQPITSADVAFSYGLLQDDDFPANAAVKALWQTVTITPRDPQTIQFELTEPYAPFLEATMRGILPAHLLQDVPPAELANHPFNQQPIGSGPWMVAPGQDWNSTRSLRLTPNPMYWREGTQISALDFRFYPDEVSLLTAFSNGEIQAINSVSDEMLPPITAVPHTRLFSTVTSQYSQLIFNQADSGFAALKLAEVRQGLSAGLDRKQLIDRALNGQGVPLTGPYLPDGWAYDPAHVASTTVNVAGAANLLNSAGWVLPEGGTVRQLEGEPFQLRLLTLDTAVQQRLAQEVTAQWGNLGVEVMMETAVSINELREKLAAQEFDVALVDITPSIDPDLYDFWSQEAIIRGQNYGGWNNRRASEALEAGRQVWGLGERRPYYNTFLTIYTDQVPAITLYQHVYTYALSSEVNQADIGPIYEPRDRYRSFASWFLRYQDVTISCPNTS